MQDVMYEDDLSADHPSMDQHLRVITAIRSLDHKSLVAALHEASDKGRLLQDNLVYHDLVEALLDSTTLTREASQMVYALMLHGANVNMQDEAGDTALLSYLCQGEVISDCVLQAFLRCGADVTLKNQIGQDVLSYVLENDYLSKCVKARVLEYLPGIWRAVDSDDAMTVRRLVNEWCSIRVSKNEMSVLELAFSKGTENIIRVISGIGTSMDLAHGVLAGDITLVKQILQAVGRYNVNLKNLSDGGATPLFYALSNNDRDMVDLLMQNGARLDVSMTKDDQMEIPLYFAALSCKPPADVDLLRHVIPSKPLPVDELYYQGRNVIFYCIDVGVHLTLFEAILRRSAVHVLTQRIPGNLDVKDYAIQREKLDYIAIIDKVVMERCGGESTNERKFLALHGYRFTLAVTMGDDVETEEDPLQQFVQMLPEYEADKLMLRTAVEDGDLILVKQMLDADHWSERGLEACLADCRLVGDGQPLLHKAVLRNHTAIVQEIAQRIVTTTHRKLDSVRDQYFRTALHYVYGMETGKTMINILEDLGMSEFAMDKDGRPPLAFKDRRGQQEMKELLQYHLCQDFSQPEPDPWSVPLPLPIMGYISKCVHAHHAKHAHQTRKQPITATPDQYDLIDRSKASRLDESHASVDQYSQIKPDTCHDEDNDVQFIMQKLHEDVEVVGAMLGTASDILTAQQKLLSHENSVESENGEKRKWVRNDNTDSSLETDNFFDSSKQESYGDDSTESNDACPPRDVVHDTGERLAGSARRHAPYSYQKSKGNYSNALKGDLSDTFSEGSESEENYMGDNSDMESEDEEESESTASHCVLL